MAAPTTDASGRLSVDVGYYEHGLSAAHWRCAVRRDKGAWVVNACAMLSIS